MENNEENKIKDAQVFSETKHDEILVENTKEKTVDDFSDQTEEMVEKERNGARSNLALIFLLGFLIGIAIKTEALKKITIGYDDYLMKIKPQGYDINGAQEKLQSEREEAAKLEEGVTGEENVDGSGAASVPEGAQDSQGVIGGQSEE